MYEFQSKHRDVDLGDKVRFSMFYYATSDEELAAFVRRNCAKNPSLYWEITPLKTATKEVAVSEVVEVPKKTGRPPRPKGVTVVSGARNSTVQEKGETQ